MSVLGGGSFVTMPSTYGATAGYGGYGGYGSYGYATPSVGYGATPSYGTYGAYPSYGTSYGYTPTTSYGGYGGNPLLENMPMGYLGVGTKDEKPKAAAKPKGKTRSVTLKKKAGGCC